MILMGSFPYDEQTVGNFILVNLSFILMLALDIALWNAEDVFICVTMSYTQARYEIIYEELDDLHSCVTDTKLFKRKLISILTKQQILQK